LRQAQTLTVYLPPETEPAALQQLAESLAPLAGVHQAAPIPPEQLAAWLRPLLGEEVSPSVVPLPQLLEVTLHGDANRGEIESLVRQNFPTAEVDDHAPLLGQLAATVRQLQLVALGLAGSMLVLMGLLLQLGATDEVLVRTMAFHTLRRTGAGSVLGSVAALLLLGGAALNVPAVADHTSGLTVVLVLGMPLLLPLVATAATALTTWRLLRGM
jgi:cell division transport system permease protein